MGTIAHNLVGAEIYGEVTVTTRGAYTQVSDIEDIVGKFNELSCARRYINADECSSFGGAYKQNNKFKNLITCTTRKMERKGLDGVIINDYTNYLMTTNSSDPVRVETSDRRFVILEIPPGNKKPRAYFDNIHQRIRQGAGVHFYKYLMSRDLGSFSPQDDRPITSAAKDMMEQQIHPVASFLQQCIQTETIVVGGLGETVVTWEEGTQIMSAQFFDAFTGWCRQENHKLEINSKSFSIRAAKLLHVVTDYGPAGYKQFTLPPIDAARAHLKAAKQWAA